MGTTIRNPLISLTLTFGAMLAMFGLTNKAPNVEFNCDLKVNYPHKSTYLFEQYKKLAIKTNVQTICKSPQAEATVWVKLFKIEQSGKTLIKSYPPQKMKGEYSPYVINFKEFFTECKEIKGRVFYQAKARALIKLRNGVVENLEAESNKSLPLNCLT